MTIGSFQFENLAQNRIAFRIFHDGIEFSGLYSGLALTHLQQCARQVAFESKEEIASVIKSEKLPTNFPVILAGRQVDQLKQQFDDLEALGFTNIFMLESPWEQIAREIQRLRET